MVTSLATAVGLCAGAGLALLWTAYSVVESHQRATHSRGAKPAQGQIPAKQTKPRPKVANRKRAVRVGRPTKRT